MHLIVPFAAASSERLREALRTIELTHLDVLAAGAARQADDPGDEHSPHPPHERALARALGWPVRDDAPLPWAARRARADGIDVGRRAWGLLTPVHWRVGSDAVRLADPRELMLEEAASRTLFEAVRPLFESEGFALSWGAPLRWYAAHDSLADVVAPALDRVIGRNVDAWLPRDLAARRMRRLQNEVQMLLHAHPLNTAREAQGAMTVNSFWLSGCGVALDERPASVTVDDRLAPAALADDDAAWRDAWMGLDVELGTRNDVALLTLCGERGSATIAPRSATWWQRARHALARPHGQAHALLETL